MKDNAPIPPQKKNRNWAVMGLLLLFVALVYGVTIVRMGGHG